MVYQNVYKALKYDPFKDLKPVSLIADFEFAIAVAPNVPVTTLPELVAWLKANPKQANFGSPGAGALPHFFGILFGKSIGVEDENHIAYRGSALALVDLIAGQVPIVVTTTSDLLAAHQGGKVRILATSDAQGATYHEGRADVQGDGLQHRRDLPGTPYLRRRKLRMRR